MSRLREQVLSWIQDDEDELISFLQALVRAPSPNPPGDTQASMRIVKDFLEARRLSYRDCTAVEEFPNIVSSFEGASPGKHLVFNGHLDVFPVGNTGLWEHDAWLGDIADGRIHGRGSSDMKGGTTAALFAFSYLSRLRDELAGKLTLLVVSDEETGGRLGSQHVIEALGTDVLGDCLLSGEPGGIGTIRFAEKGILQFSVDVRTRGAHGPYAHLSPNAIRIAGQIMEELDAVKEFKPALPEVISRRITGDRARSIIDSTMGEGTADVIVSVSMNVGTIRGGSKVNMVASDCTMEIDIRVPLGVDREEVIQKVRAIISRHPGASISNIFGGPPLFSDPEHEMANLIASQVTSLGLPEPI